MDIHDLMTIVARSRKLHDFRRFNVTTLACDLVVPSQKWKLRFLLVIEGTTLLEVLGRVARGAIISKAALVLVVDPMAIDALRWHAFVLLLRMTTSTRNRRVLAGERILGLRVIELCGAPSLLTVAVAALLSKLAGMSILGLMAAVAITRRVAVLGLFTDRVTARAARRAMGAEQGVVGRIVVEAVWVQSQDVVTSTLVLRVAAATGQPLGASISSVKALACASIRCDILMAEHAQRRLAARLERAVALAAVVLGLCVRFGDRPRHHEPLEVDRGGLAG
ncbi:MAG: hypothetical protein JRG89_16930 [Deltaproteobacteria bacterium]|nr:hypothetical protein [Deltaproteobacteria bacterium]